MFEQDSDDNRKFALWLVFGVVTLVVASVLSFAIVRTLGAGVVGSGGGRQGVGRACAEAVFRTGRGRIVGRRAVPASHRLPTRCG